MRHRWCATLTSFAAFFSLVVLAVAETPPAILYVKGEVRLNGESITRASTIFDGDRVETCGDSAVTITQDGSTIALAPGSVIRYSQYSVVLFRGTAHVDTADGMWAHAAGLTVMPKEKSSKFDLSRSDHKLTVTSRDGPLMVHDAGRTTPVEAGGTATFDDPKEDQAPHPKCKNPAISH